MSSILTEVYDHTVMSISDRKTVHIRERIAAELPKCESKLDAREFFDTVSFMYDTRPNNMRKFVQDANANHPAKAALSCMLELLAHRLPLGLLQDITELGRRRVSAVPKKEMYSNVATFGELLDKSYYNAGRAWGDPATVLRDLLAWNAAFDGKRLAHTLHAFMKGLCIINSDYHENIDGNVDDKKRAKRILSRVL